VSEELQQLLALGKPFPRTPPHPLSPSSNRIRSCGSLKPTGVNMEEFLWAVSRGSTAGGDAKTPVLDRSPDFHWEDFRVLQIIVDSSHCFKAALTVL